MSFYFRIAGGCALLFFALLCGRAYAEYSARAIAQLEGFISLLSHIRRKISVKMVTQSNLTSGFEDQSLEKCGFLPAAREGVRLHIAYTKAKICICKEARRVLDAFFSDLGRGYLADELRRINSAESECEKIIEREREEALREVKLVYTLLVASSLGILVFLI